MAAGTRYGGAHWRRVLAVLANSGARTAYAQIVLGAGLGEHTAAGALVAAELIFRDILAQQPRHQARTGVSRFMRLAPD